MKKMNETAMQNLNGGCSAGIGFVSNFLTLLLPINTGNNAVSNTLQGLLSGFTIGPSESGLFRVFSNVFQVSC